MALRHLLILTSAAPDFGHSQAAQTVCAILAESFASIVPKVTVGLACPGQAVSPASVGRLAKLGVSCIDLPSRQSPMPPPPQTKLKTLGFMAQSMLLGHGGRDRPCPDDAFAMASAIDKIGADAALLFWDSLAEFALPHIDTPAFGYLARPPHAAAIARVRAERGGLRRTVDLGLLQAQSRRHLRRMRQFRHTANVCALDAAYYAQHGVPCRYISNCWPDPVGSSWSEIRANRESQFNAPQILGNIGALDATGNSFGLVYLGNEVLPVLSSLAGDIDWKINICGPRRLAPAVASALDHPRVVIKGFVPDIDREVQSSAVFLLLNNAGPYTGGYTRVIYAFATGACLVAHRNLARSMPELAHEKNCLLANTPSGIAAQINRALREPSLRRSVGAAARATYETAFAPSRVAGRLLQMIEAGLSAGGKRPQQPSNLEVTAGLRRVGSVAR